MWGAPTRPPHTHIHTHHFSGSKLAKVVEAMPIAVMIRNVQCVEIMKNGACSARRHQNSVQVTASRTRSICVLKHRVVINSSIYKVLARNTMMTKQEKRMSKMHGYTV